jgi:hypothetical protein
MTTVVVVVVVEEEVLELSKSKLNRAEGEVEEEI